MEHRTSTNRKTSHARRTKTSTDNALTMLAEDHARVKKLFKQFEKLDRQDEDACRQIVETTCSELEVHAQIEEEIFYPAVREATEDEEIMEEASVEHATAKNLIAQLKRLNPSDASYAATFTVLGEYVKHHADEEERQMFPLAKKAKLDFQTLGQEMTARRKELKGESDE